MPVQSDTNILSVIVRSYLKHNRRRLRNELAYFEGVPSLDSVIEAAALATCAHGKRLNHQRRLTRAALARSEENLVVALPRLRECRSFEELYTLIEELVRGIRGLGELYVYDTSLRIAAYLNLWPEEVYLHAGTRRGARALGFSGQGSRLKPSELPAVVRKLKPFEIEDFLCIYKEQLKQVRHKVTR